MGWSVDVDQATFEKYRTVPAGPLRTLMDKSVLRSPEANGGDTPAPFARIQMSPSLQCPFHNAEQLCQIQVEHGAEYLSHTCATFPRSVFDIDHFKVATLTLACPEAARLVLLTPNILSMNGEPAPFVTWDDAAKSFTSLRSNFWAVWELSIALIRNRNYPLWQRMFLLGTFSRRLQAVVRGESDRGFPALLKDFAGAVVSGKLRASIETIPADLPLQLQMVMQLVNMQVQGKRIHTRLQECLNAFMEGIGNGRETTLDGQCARYSAAYSNYYTPFFVKHPGILENLLMNSVFRRLFPFGAGLFDLEAKPEPAREFALLATEFALLKGLLIGVAGCRKEAFSKEHVVHTVQIVSKSFQHNSAFLINAHQLLVARNMDNARGLTMLLRN